MGILVWTLGPSAVATALAVLWVRWANRTRRPIGTKDSLAAHERFKAAIVAPPRRPKREMAGARKR